MGFCNTFQPETYYVFDLHSLARLAPILYYNSGMAKNGATLILRLPATILAQLDRAAGDAFESRSIIVRKFIEAGLQKKFGTAHADGKEPRCKSES